MKKKKQPRTEEIGIRELKSRASEVVRAVKEERARYIITQRGKPVAAIIPTDAVLPEEAEDDGWEKLLALRERLGKGKSSKKNSVEILSEMRR
jgi:prevent-host-death family protein